MNGNPEEIEGHALAVKESNPIRYDLLTFQDPNRQERRVESTSQEGADALPADEFLNLGLNLMRWLWLTSLGQTAEKNR